VGTGKRSGIGVSLADIQAARQEIRKHLEPSPLLESPWLSEQLGGRIFLKLENMHPIGSFKIRGAIYRVSRLSAKERKRGVIAASAGNHAQGVAWAARLYGVRSEIVMPKGATLVKVQNTKSLGAEVILEGDTYEDALVFARKRARKTGKVFIHGFEDADVIAGQGTAGLEILEQLPDLDVVIGAVGGGGWMAGLATAIKALRPECQVVAAQAKGASAMIQSVRSHRHVKLREVQTIADGIAIPDATNRMRHLLEPLVDRWVEMEDEAIASSILTLMEKAKILTEGAGALPLAVAEHLRSESRGVFKGKKVVLAIGGGNVDVNMLSRILDRGLIKLGRRLRVNVLLSDRPGSLARLATLIAEHGANILQAIHDRSEATTGVGQTDVALTLETKGPEHSNEVIRALRAHVLRIELVS